LSRADEISERLPHFYNHWDQGSSIFGLIAAMGKRLDESEKELISIMRLHWIDTASRDDLDKLGALYNIKRKEDETDSEFRDRLKTAIISYKGGGTIDAIQMFVKLTLKLPQDYPVQIIENPPLELKRTWKVSAGREWVVNPRNIKDTVPDIILTIETENTKIADPTITNLTIGETITYRGNLSHGDVLKISKGKAMLNNEDCTSKLSTASIPKLPRKKSRWKYTEYIGANLGAFDQTQFDQSVFVIEILSSVTFEWTANQPAAFDLMLPREILMKSGVTAEHMQDLVDSIKACGVKAKVKVI
jgi:hypothetical protein